MHLNLWQKYGPAIVAFLYACYTVTVPLWSGDHDIDPNEALVIIAAFGTNVIVYITPLRPELRWTKTAVNIVGVVVVSLQSVIGNGIDANEAAIVIGALVSVVLGAYAPKATTTGSTPTVVPAGLTTG